MQLVKQGQSSTRESILRLTLDGLPESRFTVGGKYMCVFSGVGFSYRALGFEMWEPVDIEGFITKAFENSLLIEPVGFEIVITGYIKIREYVQRDGVSSYRNVFIVRTWKECNDHSNGNHGENPAQTIQEDAG